jgi:hypothetical protein
MKIHLSKLDGVLLLSYANYPVMGLKCEYVTVVFLLDGPKGFIESFGSPE